VTGVDKPASVDNPLPVSDPGTTTIPDGREDIRRAAEELAERLPEPLAPLAGLAYNYRWSWLPGGPELFASIDRERFELCLQNPVRLLQEASSRALRRAAENDALVLRARELQAEVQADLARPVAGGLEPSRPVAFLCAEYGVHVSLPIYSGGLGALAGDLLKEASDQRVPMVAVGLMYRKGYFRQRIDRAGWQHEYWIDTDPQRLPAARVTEPNGNPLTVEIPIYDTPVLAYVWRVDVGRVPLFLLDADLSRNAAMERWITGRLYEADPTTRLAQYVLLGAGGIRALRAMGIAPGVIHLNEGHAALAPLQLAGGGGGGQLGGGDGGQLGGGDGGQLGGGDGGQLGGRDGAQLGGRDGGQLGGRDGLGGALAFARSHTVFTTHTPVAAGNDSYPSEQVSRAIAALARELALPEAEVIALGRNDPDDATEPFGMTQAALRLSRAANGVSRRHGEVSRQMWSVLWPDRAVDEVPIGHVTNGVHIPTWIGDAMRELLDRHLGADWTLRAADPRTWERVDDVPDEELWQVREQQREELLEFVRRRSTQDRLLRGDVPEYVDAAARGFDDHVLTIGFARRVATYKRLELLIRDPEWTISLLSGDRPVQVVLAGKAHPRDEDAKRSLQQLFGLKFARAVGDRVVYLDDYDLATAALLVRGCDVWLNLPRPPLEASGTSGMKSAFNGGLQLSVLDGWWAEAYDGANGWALPGDASEDSATQDARDAEVLHATISDEVVPAFYDRDERGLPSAWLARIRASLRSLGPRFGTARMLAEYVNGPYRDLAQAGRSD
jgi:glycogen phosphorylase